MKNLIGFWTIFRKEMYRLSLTWKSALFAPIISTTLYFIIFGAFIGSRIGDMEGISYMQFIIPGIIMMPAITGSYMHTTFAVYLQRFSKSIDDIIVSPLQPVYLLFGFVFSGIVRGFIISSLVFGVSLYFAPLKIFNLGLIILFMFLTSTVFSLLGFLTALFARNFDDNNVIPTFVLTPLTYLGGVFYSVSLLPEFWQTVSKLNPILYMVNGFRYGFLGISDVPVMHGVILLCGLVISLVFINLYCIRKGYGLKS